jgi:hypothetical protein
MFKVNARLTTHHAVNLADLETYGCLPMSIGELMDEFENFPIFDEDDWCIWKI